LEELFSYEQLHKSTYYDDGGIRAAILSGDLDIIDQDELLEAVWRVSAPRIEYISLTEDHISAKRVELGSAPRKGQIALDVLGGIAQFPGIDFSVADKNIVWDSLCLDGLLEAGDVLRITYGS